MSSIDTSITKKYVAVFSADIAGYSSMMENDEIGTYSSLLQHREMMQNYIYQYNGRINNTAGDSVLAEFETSSDAVECAVQFQDAARHLEHPGNSQGMHFRIGVHYGQVMPLHDDIIGKEVNIAARIQAIAEPGEVVISSDVYNKIHTELDARYIDLGRRSVKNIETPVHVFSVSRSQSNKTRQQRQIIERPSIAVLPFKNLNKNAEDDYFADGVAGEIITALSRAKTLVIIARGSSFGYRDTGIDIHEAAKKLGVRYILRGNLQRSERRVRLNVHLDDAEGGTTLWSDHFDGDNSDIFELQDQIAERVVGALEAELRSAEIIRQKRRPTDNLSAYDQTLRGISLFYDRSEKSSLSALTAFYKAIDLDPDYALPYGYAAMTLVLRRAQGWPPRDIDTPEECIRLAELASMLGPDDPTALSLAGMARVYFGHEPEISKNIIEEAIFLNPNSAVGWYAMGILRMSQGDHRAAASAIFRSLALNPRDPGRFAYITSLALAEYLDGNCTEAVALVDKALGMHPNYLPALRVKAAATAMLGGDAGAVVAKLNSLDPDGSVAKAAQQMIRLQASDMKLYHTGLRQSGLRT
ncbi:adenylate/guanylate cyclase domain-containing protein [Bosea sp. WAO]|uniref:adenylate/guanylate cyclase domain-containing protein n=1 Tax=Bosea sp. WAO TaxID=406341 RepID=UPI0009F85606|nr:adenylate/guanylate cyclase domain-containing protein [Bosea sp. WAO]